MTRWRFGRLIPGAVIARVPAANEADVELAVGRARAAHAEWAARSFADRGRIFLRFHDLLLKRQAEVLDIIQLETGKARRHAFEEILDTAVVARYYARHAEQILRPRRRRGALPLLTQTWEFRCPIGVVGFIVPWNYPLNLAITDAIAALMAGNTGVLRPDPQTTLDGALGSRAPARGGPSRGRAGRGERRRTCGRGGSRRARRLRDVHRQFAHRANCRTTRRRSPDSLLAGTGRQESDDRARRRGSQCSGRRRDPRLFRGRRPGLRVHRADLRA